MDVAEGAGLVVVATSHELCALAVATGSKRWCSRNGLGPAIARKIVAVHRADGSIVALSGIDGHVVWSKSFSTHSDGPEISTRSSSIWSGKDTFVTLTPDSSPRDTSTLSEITSAGRVVWAERVAITGTLLPSPLYSSRYVIIASDAATEEQSLEYVFRLGVRNQRPIVIPNASAVVAVRNQNATFVVDDPTMTPETAFTTIGLFDADLQNGKLSPITKYSPLDSPSVPSSPESEAEDSSDPPAARIARDGTVYISVRGRIYQYRDAFADPVLVSTRASLVDVLTTGGVLVDRTSGVWLIQIKNGGVHDEQVMHSDSPLVDHLLIGTTLYALFADGSLHAAGLGAEATERVARGCVGENLVHSPSTIIKLCYGDASTTIEAYDQLVSLSPAGEARER